MDDYISREAALKAIFDSANSVLANEDPADASTMIYLIATSNAREAVKGIPTADVRPVVYCKDCIHRPYETVPGVRYGLTVESPDSVYKCPCYCDGDGWYSYIPDDDFFCGNGERLREGGTP